MKNVAWFFFFNLTFAHALQAQSPELAAFNTLLRDLDLNAEMQNGYAITAAEYDTLLSAWQKLGPSDKLELHGLERYYWEDTFAEMLLCDFVLGITWERHVEKMLKLGARDLSLTLSRDKCPMTVATARQNLADLLHTGPSMFNEGRLQIPEEIKIAAQTRAGSKARERLQDWEDLINRLQLASEWEKMNAVNAFFNRAVTASAEGKGNDYWQSPIETLAAGRGDCDDYAVAKYVSLRMLGIAAEQMRLGVVSLPHAGNHAVLLFFSKEEQNPWVLDNLGSTRLGSDADLILRLRARNNLDGMKLLWGMNEKTLSKFQAGAKEEKLSSHPYKKFLAAATTFANSYRLFPPSAWGQCEREPGNDGCICYRLGILFGAFHEN